MRHLAVASAILLLAGGASAQEGPRLPDVAVVQMPYTGSRNVDELSDNPSYLHSNGVTDSIQALGFGVVDAGVVRLTADDERSYGEWHRMGLANGHLGDMVAQQFLEGRITVGLLGNCTSVIGMLGGLQRAGPGGDLQDVALVFIDAHGDFNTPETTLSGMLGGMPVATAAGLGLHNLRRTSGLDPALPSHHIVMGGLRDLDPLERELIEGSQIRQISTDDLRHRPDAVRAEMERLSRLADVIYVHIDMDVLDPREVPGHPLTVSNGPTSLELGAALTEMFRFEKVAALGIASTPANERDPDGLSLKAAYNLVDGALAGVLARGR